MFKILVRSLSLWYILIMFFTLFDIVARLYWFTLCEFLASPLLLLASPLWGWVTNAMSSATTCRNLLMSFPKWTLMESSRDLPMCILPSLRGRLIPFDTLHTCIPCKNCPRQQTKIRELYDRCKQECFSWINFAPGKSKYVLSISVFCPGKHDMSPHMERCISSHGVRSWSDPGAAKPFASKAALCCLDFKGSFPGESLSSKSWEAKAVVGTCMN